VVVLSSVTLLAFGKVAAPLRARVQDRVTALDQAGGRLAGPANRLAKKARSNAALEKEVARLRQELDVARANSLRYDDAVRERKELLELNGFKDPDGYKSVRARVIGTALNNLDETIRIDRGSTHGLVVDLPVVSASGLVGRVVDVTPKSATVRLITDTEMSVGVRFARSGEVAIANGQHQGNPLRLDLVSLTAQVAKGDVVVTSGLQNSRFPPEIPVGRVRTVRPGSILQDVTVTPAVDLRRISFVKVLLGTGPS
jgi:rod shape-determining protein MreC